MQKVLPLSLFLLDAFPQAVELFSRNLPRLNQIQKQLFRRVGEETAENMRQGFCLSLLTADNCTVDEGSSLFAVLDETLVFKNSKRCQHRRIRQRRLGGYFFGHTRDR